MCINVRLAINLASSSQPPSSAGQITPVGSPPYFVVIDRALRDEGTSYHYAAPEAFAEADPNIIFSCATCTLFEPPKSCKVVEGEVSKDGWCKAFALAD
jgi:hypothetical protein